MSDRLAVRKTYKLWIGGAFVRSESGRYDHATGAGGRTVNIPRASRKDVRDAVAAARKAAGPWAGRTAYNRGQILYRAAEALESNRERFEAAEVEASVDVLLHYAGWTDKLAPVLGGINPVAAPFLSFSLPEPTGVVGIVAPDAPPLLGLVAEVAPALAAGDVVVAVLSEAEPLAGLDLAEVLGVADVPGGVVNLLSGRRDELASALGAHRDLNAIVDAAGDTELAAKLDGLASETIKRTRHAAAATSYADAVDDALERLAAVTELKTAWHPVGA
ncbi:MAG TPA: aldehyde dehydrogenase family protein [Solirubrobacteraceae bacterium]|nr:aldehyde dehydrogenase family protein [Solirubrobacteraceae bacterium]